MTNKAKLQAEILAKIKEGVKPSDLKKPRLNKQTKNKPSQAKEQKPSAYVNGKEDQGYESDQSNKSIPKAPALPNSQIKDLQSQITALQKQLQLYKDFREGDLKVKEDLKKSLWALNKDQEGYKETIADLEQKNQSLNKTIADLQNQAKAKANIKTEPKEPQESKPSKLYLFTCDICEQTKKSQLHLGKVNGLGIDPNKENKICDTCIRKVDLILPPQEEFF
jgi:hypothetical protein